MEVKKYKKTKEEETETIINVLYSENLLSIYSNKIPVQKKLNRYFGKATKEYMMKDKICGSVWEIHFEDSRDVSEILKKIQL